MALISAQQCGTVSYDSPDPATTFVVQKQAGYLSDKFLSNNSAQNLRLVKIDYFVARNIGQTLVMISVEILS